MTKQSITNRPNQGRIDVEQTFFSVSGHGNIIPKVDNLILDLLQEGQFENIQPTFRYGVFACSPEMLPDFSRIAARHGLAVEAAV